MKTLYIIRGLPGSGKSTFAKKLTPYYYEADQYFMEDGEYLFDRTKLGNAHRNCQSNVEKAMEQGVDVAVSNTSTTEKELQPYFDLAEKHGYTIFSVIVENRHGNVSIHDVPEEAMTRMRNRFSVRL